MDRSLLSSSETRFCSSSTLASDPAINAGNGRRLVIKVKAVEHNHYVGGRNGTHDVQPSSQQLVFIGEFFVRQQQLLVQFGLCGRASLKRGSISFMCKDSRRVIFTRLSFNYSTRISGTGDK